jgi:hypothetical protein
MRIRIRNTAYHETIVKPSLETIISETIISETIISETIISETIMKPS